MKSSLLAFHPITGQHTGQRIAEVVFKLLRRAGINGGDVSNNFYHAVHAYNKLPAGISLDVGYGCQQQHFYSISRRLT